MIRKYTGISPCPRTAGPALLLLAALVAAPGCEGVGSEPVVSYSVPKEAPPPPPPSNLPPPPARTADGTPAGLPDGHPPLGGSPAPAPELPAGHPPLDGTPTAAPALPAMPAPTDGPVMVWTLPDGWAADPAPRSMRFATLTAGEGDARIEVAISRLRGSAGGLVPNVNLWRQQVGLPPAVAEDVPDMVVPIVAQSAQGGMFDITGVPADGADGPPPRMLVAVFPTETHTWFLKAVGDETGLEPYRQAFVDLCSSVRFEDAAADAGAAVAAGAATSQPAATQPAGGGSAPAGMAWGDLPAGWSVDASPKPMSVASLTVTTGAGQGSMTITRLGGNQDLLANINRWRGQVGLETVPDLATAAPVPLEVSGAPSHMVELLGPDNGILGVVSTRGAATWFYKLTGPAPLVAAERPAFERFLGTLRIDG